LSQDNSLIAISQNLCTKQFTMSTLPFYIPLVFGVSIAMALFLFYRASGRSLTFLLLALGWIVLQGLLSATGFYTAPDKPLRFPLLLVPPVVLGLIFSYTPKGRRFFSTLDIRLLTLLQLIRLLVEPVLYWLSLYHLVPRVMTFEGKNFDILTGLTVPIIYYFGFVRRTLPTWLMMTCRTNARSCQCGHRSFSVCDPAISVGLVAGIPRSDRLLCTHRVYPPPGSRYDRIANDRNLISMTRIFPSGIPASLFPVPPWYSSQKVRNARSAH
jgi:hypothetical protein